MIKIKDWLKNRNGVQFVPKNTISPIKTIDKAIRIKDEKIFALLAFHEGESKNFFYDKESGNTIKQEIGIWKFHDDNIHVDVVCHSKFIELSPHINDIKVIPRIPINDIEPLYADLFSTGQKIMLEKLKCLS